MINNSRTREQPLTISATVVKELQDRQKFAQNFGQKVNQNIAQNFGQSLQYLYAFFLKLLPTIYTLDWSAIHFLCGLPPVAAVWGAIGKWGNNW